MRILARHRRNILRCLMRGNSKCRISRGFEAVRDLKNGLVGVRLEGFQSGVEWLFGASANKAELLVRQFVFDRFGGTRLNRGLFAYLGSNKPITMGMPSEWRRYLESNGWPVNHIASAVFWQAAIFLRFVHGIVEIAALCFKVAIRRSVFVIPKDSAYFEGLALCNLPSINSQEVSYDICSCYSQWPNVKNRIRSILHSVKGATALAANGIPVTYTPPPYDLAKGILVAFSVAGWGLAAAIWAGINACFGRWGGAIVLGEAAKAKVVRMLTAEQIAQEYLFHGSRTIYRPMWTYEVEKSGARVALYFYSTMAQPRKADVDELQLFEWGPNTWPEFIVWDRFQADRVKRDLGNSLDVIEVGPVYFSDNGARIPLLPENAIAVFDIQPLRISAHLGFSTLSDCLADHPDFYHQFLTDVVEVLKECGGTVALKTKREIGSRGDRRYGQILRAMGEDTQVCFVDPNSSAMKLAMACRAAISAPFTSTALYAQKLGRPSVYYDPVGWIQLGDDGAHGVPIIRGKKELRTWVEGVLTGTFTPVA